MLLKKMQLIFVTHFSFDFILSAVESYKLHVRSPVGFGRQWRTFISRHFFWILKKEMKVPHWISCILEQHCIWPGFLPLENVCDLLLQHFEKEMLLIFFFSGISYCGILYLWCIFSKIFILKAAAACFYFSHFTASSTASYGRKSRTVEPLHWHWHKLFSSEVKHAAISIPLILLIFCCFYGTVSHNQLSSWETSHHGTLT